MCLVRVAGAATLAALTVAASACGDSPAGPSTEAPAPSTTAVPTVTGSEPPSPTLAGQLAFVNAAGDTWLAGDSAKPRRIIAGCGVRTGEKDESELALAWSPDGKQLACVTANGTVLLWSYSRGEVTEALPAGACSRRPEWAPGGAAFACRVDPNQVRVAALGRSSVLLEAAEFQWSPAAALLAIRQRGHGLLIADVNGAEVLRLDREVSPSRLAWDRSGTRFAYHGEGSITVVKTGGSPVKVIPVPWKSGQIGGWSGQDRMLVQPVGGGLPPQVVTVPDGPAGPSGLAGAAEGLVVSNDYQRVAYALAPSFQIHVAALTGSNDQPIAGSRYFPLGYGGARGLSFSSDGAGLCWVDASATIVCSRLPYALARALPAAAGDGSSGLPPLHPLNREFTWVAFTIRTGQRFILTAQSLDSATVVEVAEVPHAGRFAWRPEP